MDTQARQRPTTAFLIMVAAMLGAVCAMVSSALEPTTYRATATVFLSRQGATSVADLRGDVGFAPGAADVYADAATSPFVLDGVVRRLGLQTTTAALAQRIDVERAADTDLLQISASDADPARAAAVADAVVHGLARLESSTTRVTGLRAARVPTAPSGLALPLVVLIGLSTAGGIAGAVLLVAWTVRRRPPPGAGIAAPSMSTA